jgi:hypothetical protein
MMKQQSAQPIDPEDHSEREKMRETILTIDTFDRLLQIISIYIYRTCIIIDYRSISIGVCV